MGVANGKILTSSPALGARLARDTGRSMDSFLVHCLALLPLSRKTPKAPATAASLVPFQLERSITLVFGMTGMGKTRWSKAYLRDHPRQIIMDMKAEHDGILFDDLGKMIDHIQAYDTFKVRTFNPDDFDDLCKIAYAAGRCTLVIEEAEGVMPASSQRPPNSFRDIVYRGRHERVSVVLIAQRPSSVHISARSQWNRIVTFRQTEPADVQWLESVCGYDIDPLGLRQSEYYDIGPEGFQKKTLDISGNYVVKELPDDAANVPNTEEEVDNA